MNRQRSLTIGLLLLGCLFLVACDSQESIQEQSVTGKSVRYYVTAKALIDAYDANEIAADQKYKDKVIQVSGQVEDISEDIMGDPYITLCIGEYGFDCVQCYFADSEKGKLARLSKGQNVKVKGLCTGKPFHVSLKGCELK